MGNLILKLTKKSCVVLLIPASAWPQEVRVNQHTKDRLRIRADCNVSIRREEQDKTKPVETAKEGEPT
jgi:hypothetical protein